MNWAISSLVSYPVDTGPPDPRDSLRKQGSNKCETAQIWAFQAVFREI